MASCSNDLVENIKVSVDISFSFTLKIAVHMNHTALHSHNLNDSFAPKIAVQYCIITLVVLFIGNLRYAISCSLLHVMHVIQVYLLVRAKDCSACPFSSAHYGPASP